MKSIKKVIFFLFSCIALNLSTHCFYNDGNNAWRGAAIGGLAGGRKGAAIGLGVGAFSDIASNAAADNRRRRYYDDDEDYYERRRSRKRRKLEEHNEDLQRENEDLRNRLNKYEQE
jgi:hypothetical protein